MSAVEGSGLSRRFGTRLAVGRIGFSIAHGLDAQRTLVLGGAPRLPLAAEQRRLAIMAAALAAAGAAVLWVVRRHGRHAGTLAPHQP